MQGLILLALFISITGCEKDKDSNPTIDKQYLIGKWVNTQLNTDTLFWNDTIIMRTDTITLFPKHSYHYELIEDSVILEYTGEYYILAPKSTHKLIINNEKSVITIENLENYFPEYKGNQFMKIND
ncbi:MAG: hypothetical protein KAQ75_00140 [Bacteroidales bacterium]|nr:hypothetical protein [Bacteroidales bacterium]